MANPFLPQSVEKLITNNIDEMYEKLKQRLFGFFYEPKMNLGVKSDKTVSLPGLYTAAYADSGAKRQPSLSTMRALTSVAESYINASAEKTKAQALNSVLDAISTAQKKDDFDYEKELNDALMNVFDQAHGDTKKVIETELQRTKTVGLQEGIIEVLKDQGFDDPTVAFITRQDAEVCKYCKAFFVQDDGITPRVYKLSELGAGYLDRKAPKPILPPVHPNCFLYGTGRVYTQKGFKRIKNVSFHDKVMTHALRWHKVINTLNFLKTPYQQNYYEIRPYPGTLDPVCVTPDHQVFTNHGFKPISEISYLDDKLVRVVKKCVVCAKNMVLNYPKYFCSDICRDKALVDGAKYLDQFSETKLELEEFSPDGAVFHHDKTEPTFLYDITVNNDHSLMYNGLVTKNCRCLMVPVYAGFTFKNGELVYKSEGYDEYTQQRSLKKSVVDIKTMLEHDCNEHRNNELLAYLK